MLSRSEIKGYLLEEIRSLDDRRVLLDLYYILIRANGLHYGQIRSARLAYELKQLKLFNGNGRRK